MPVEERDRPWRAVALLVAAALFMEILDGTIVATAAPRMAQTFGVRSADINVAIAAYLMALGVFIPASGWVADRFGTRRVFAAAIVVFSTASALCAASVTLGELTTMRVLQGIGGAMMVPVGRLVVLRRSTKSELIAAIAYLTWPALTAPLVAPLLGGVFATYTSWRWIFVINVPLGVVALIVALRIIPDLRGGRVTAVDWRGFLLTGGGIGLFLYALELFSERSPRWTLVGPIGGIGVLALALAVAHLRRATTPLLQLRVLRITTYKMTIVGGSLYRTAITSVPFLLPLFFQDGFGWTPLKSGLLVIAVFVGNFVIKPVTTPLLRSLGFRRLLVLNGIAAAFAIGACAALTAHTPLAVIALVLFAGGVFRSIGFTAYNTIAFADVGPDELNDANTMASAVQQVCGGLGVAVGALFLRIGGSILHLGRSGEDFRSTFVLVGLIALAAVVDSARLPRAAGSSIITPPHPTTPSPTTSSQAAGLLGSFDQAPPEVVGPDG